MNNYVQSIHTHLHSFIQTKKIHLSQLFTTIIEQSFLQLQFMVWRNKQLYENYIQRNFVKLLNVSINKNYGAAQPLQSVDICLVSVEDYGIIDKIPFKQPPDSDTNVARLAKRCSELGSSNAD